MNRNIHPYISTALIILALLLIPAHALSDSDYQARSFINFDTYLQQGLSILFGIDTVNYNYVALQPTTGNLNGTNCQLWFAENYGGKYSFLSKEEATILISTSLENVKVNGQQYVNGQSFIITAGAVYTIEWSYTLAPYLPFGLILGILGVAFLLVGPLYLIYQFRHHEYKALITGMVITIVGIAFIIGWLW